MYQENTTSKKEVALIEKERDEYAELDKELAEYNQKLQERKNQAKEKILELFKMMKEGTSPRK